MKTYKLIEEDVIDVAKSLNMRLTPAQIDWVIDCYEDSQRQDPTATWDLIVEDLLQQFKNNFQL